MDTLRLHLQASCALVIYLNMPDNIQSSIGSVLFLSKRRILIKCSCESYINAHEFFKNQCCLTFSICKILTKNMILKRTMRQQLRQLAQLCPVVEDFAMIVGLHGIYQIKELKRMCFVLPKKHVNKVIV